MYRAWKIIQRGVLFSSQKRTECFFSFGSLVAHHLYNCTASVAFHGTEQIGTVASCPSCDSSFHARCVEAQAPHHQPGKFPTASGSSKWWLDDQTEAGGNEFVCPKVRVWVGVLCPVSGAMWIIVFIWLPTLLTSCGRALCAGTWGSHAMCHEYIHARQLDVGEDYTCISTGSRHLEHSAVLIMGSIGQSAVHCSRMTWCIDYPKILAVPNCSLMNINGNAPRVAL